MKWIGNMGLIIHVRPLCCFGDHISHLHIIPQINSWKIGFKSLGLVNMD